MLKLLLIIALATFATGKTPMQKVVNGNTVFGMKVFKQLLLGDKGYGNIAFSPLSAHTILALTYTGARGDTASEMAEVMSLPDRQTTAAGFKALMKEFRNTKENEGKISVNMANKIYPNLTMDLKEEFVDMGKQSFNIGVENLNFMFNRKQSADIINKWVEERTNNKIKDLIAEGDLVGTNIVLVNALYFGGKWKYTFNLTDNPLTFKQLNGEVKKVPAMKNIEEYLYGHCKKLNAQILVLPYMNEDYVMVIVLPHKKNDLLNLRKKLPLNLDKIRSKLTLTMVNVTLPKFHLNDKIDLVPILQELGMNKALTSSADFSGMTDYKMTIGKVIQQVYVDVTEKGTEAAAATYVTMVGMVPGQKVKNLESFYADKPFLFMIYRRSTKTMMFMGQVAEF